MITKDTFESIPWLRGISRWPLVAVKNLLAEGITDGPHETPEFLNEGYPFLSVDGIQEGELTFDQCRFISDEQHRAFRKKAAPRRGDILFGKAASTGKIARVKTDRVFSIWSPLALLRPCETKITSGFLEYALKSLIAQAQIDVLVTTNTQNNISMEAIPRIRVPLPSRPHQQVVVEYLDRETARLDALVVAKERVLGLLAEKRRALITRAFTRGLDPHALLRDSGVSWLGEIPAHWEIVALRFLVHLTSGSTPDTGNQEYWNGDIPWISPKDMKQADIDDAQDHVSELALTETGINLINAGAVLIVVRGMILLHSFPIAINTRPVTINQDMKALRCSPVLASHYLRDVFRGLEEHIVSIADSSAHGTRKLETEVLGHLKIPLPPLAEQQKIMTHLNKVVSKIEALCSATAATVALLKERRAALISAAVIGRIDLQGDS